MSGGGIGTEFIVFLVGPFTRGIHLERKWWRRHFFAGKKSNWYISWYIGETSKRGKITWRENGGGIPRKGPSQLSPCGVAKRDVVKSDVQGTGKTVSRIRRNRKD